MHSQANAFLAQHEQNWLDIFPLEHRLLSYRRYVDYILVLFKSSNHLKRFQSYLNSCPVNMSFTIETEQNNKTLMLDVNVIREQGKFMTNVYRKPNFSAVFTIETEQNNKTLMLDVNVIREQGKFMTNVYRKPNFSAVYTPFDSFLSDTYKFDMIYTFVNRCFQVCSIIDVLS